MSCFIFFRKTNVVYGRQQWFILLFRHFVIIYFSELSDNLYSCLNIQRGSSMSEMFANCCRKYTTALARRVYACDSYKQRYVYEDGLHRMMI